MAPTHRVFGHGSPRGGVARGDSGRRPRNAGPALRTRVELRRPDDLDTDQLISAEYDLLRRYTKRGVQVVSPLTFGHKLELIKADVQARKLSEEADAIRRELEQLEGRFDVVEEKWETLYRHLSNAKNKADDVNRRYEDLRNAFDRIEEPAAGDPDAE